MADFWICVQGELESEQVEKLEGAGIWVDDLRRISGGFGTPIQWETLRTCARVSEADEAAARAKMADVLGVDYGALTAYSAEIFR
jgi:hypothetical protein